LLQAPTKSLDSADLAAGRISDSPAKGQNPWALGSAAGMENDDSRPVLSQVQGSEFSCAGFQTGVKFYASNFADANARRFLSATRRWAFVDLWRHSVRRRAGGAWSES